MARDGGTPQLSSSAPLQLSIQVIRDNHPPVFERSLYTVSINENEQPGQAIMDVRADDADPAVGSLGWRFLTL